MTKIFVDGAQGTTGLRIFERLAQRTDLTVLELPEERRKDAAARREMLHTADIAFLCLPDDAAREAVALAQGSRVRIIDASTAHRTDKDWCYGLPELSAELTARIASASRVAVPGCHASGFAALVYPLVQAEILSKKALLSCFSVTGCSGGGKPMIAQYADETRAEELDSPRQYGLTQTHKHLKEMHHISGLETAPIFSPIVADFYCGMAVSVPLHTAQILRRMEPQGLQEFYTAYYAGRKLLRSAAPQEGAADGFLAANTLAGRDCMEILVGGNERRLVLTARFDNLGKGASGAAVQCMNLMLGLPEETGLTL